MTCSDGSLKRVGAARATEFFCTIERSQAATDEQLIPEPAILIEQQDRFARRAGSRSGTRCLDFHQRDKGMNFRLFRSEFSQEAAETERIFAERGSHPVATSSGRVALVKNEVDDFEHRREAGSKFRSARDLERNALIGECSLGPHDPLGYGRLRCEEGARDFVGREAAEQAKRESHARLGGKNRVARYENEAQQVVANIIVERGFEIRHGHLLLRLKLATQLRMLEFEALVASPEIDGTILRGSHKPGARVIGNSGLRPLLECCDESILSEFLGKPGVADDSRKACDDSGRLDSPDGVDDAMYVGSRHGYPSHHLQSGGASPGCRDSSSRYFSRKSPTNERSYALQSKASGPSTWRTSVSPSQPGQYFL